jgi:hypothetical protein
MHEQASAIPAQSLLARSAGGAWHRLDRAAQNNSPRIAAVTLLLRLVRAIRPTLGVRGDAVDTSYGEA